MEGHCHRWRFTVFTIRLQLVVIAVQTVLVDVRIVSPEGVDHQGKISSDQSEVCDSLTFSYTSSSLAGSVSLSCASVCPPERSTDKSLFFCWKNCPAYLECRFPSDENVASLHQLYTDNQTNCSSNSFFFHIDRLQSCRQVCFRSTKNLEFCRSNCPGFYACNEALLSQLNTSNSAKASSSHHLLRLAFTSNATPHIAPATTSSPDTDPTTRPREVVAVTWEHDHRLQFVILLTVLCVVLLVLVGVAVVILRCCCLPTVGDKMVPRFARGVSNGNTNEPLDQTREQTSRPPGGPVSASLCTQPSHYITVSMSEANENQNADETQELLATDPDCRNSSSSSLIPAPSALGSLSLHSCSS